MPTFTGDNQANLLVGAAGDDTIFGLGGNDTLDGGAGSDAMHGGTGDDFYHVDSTSDRVIEAPRRRLRYGLYHGQLRARGGVGSRGVARRGCR